MKRITSLLLLFLMMAGLLPATAFADAATNEAVFAMGAALSEKYGISILHSMTEGGDAGIALNSLEILDKALETVTPSVVRQVSGYYRARLGRALTFEYVETYDGLDAKSAISVAGFSPSKGAIGLFLPTRTGTTVVTGDSPITIVHEFGHALYFMLADRYGEDRLKGDWLSFNAGIDYDPAYIAESPDERIFITGYAATMYEEDFAEVLGHCFIRNKAGQGFTGQLSANGRRSGLGRKIDYVDQLLSAAFPDDSEMLANFRKTLSAPTGLEYQGMALSGMYLQYIGYRQPRYILDGSLNFLGKRREYAAWLREIGGWYVLEPGGNEIIVFPGLVWDDVPEGFVAPQA